MYKISSPGCGTCYIGQTRRHLISRLREHRSAKTGAVRTYFLSCISEKPEIDDVEILATTSKDSDHLLALEALFIREIKPALNTKDEYRSRERVRCLFILSRVFKI